VAAVTAAPASADPPTEFTVGFTLYGEPDPCAPGETHDVTFTFQAQEQSNLKTTVWVVDSYAESTRGYVGNGTETQVTNQNWIIDHVNWQLVHPETGDRFKVKGDFRIDVSSGEVVHEHFAMTCEGRVR
jgi:hypothetical protein